jgi:hypothetical protein
MSSDKLYTNLSNLVEFYMGERPSADKFNAVNRYFSRGLAELAAAVGDIHDKGSYIYNEETTKKYNLAAKYNLTGVDNKNRPSDIVNLARIIGPASNLNARMFRNTTLSNSITETIPAGVSEFECQHIIKGVPEIANWVENSSAPNFYNNFQNNLNLFVVMNKKSIIFNKVLVNSLEVTYNTNPSEYHGGIDYLYAGFNTIPDPNQTTGLEIIKEDDKYRVTFPKILKQQSSLVNLSDTDLGTAADFNNNLDYELPKWLNEVMDSLTSKIIPNNFLYLKRRDTGEVFTDAVYEWVDAKTLLVSNIDLCVDVNTNQVEDDYCIVTVGTNITTSIDDLKLKWFKHSHDGTFGESLVSIKTLADKYESVPPSGIYGPSQRPWNQLPMYLHRDGYVADSNSNNGNNAMRGPLLMGLTSFDPLSNAQIGHDTGTSQPILFGGDPAKIFRAGKTLKIKNTLDGENDLGIEITAEGALIARSKEDNVLMEAASGNVTVNAIDGSVYVISDENVVVDADENVLVTADETYSETSNTNNQIYSTKIENNSIVKKSNIPATPKTVTTTAATYSYSGYTNRTSEFNLYQIVNKTKYTVLKCAFNPSAKYIKDFQWALFPLSNSIVNIYQPEYLTRAYGNLLVNDGLNQFLLIAENNGVRTHTQQSNDIRETIDASARGEYFWDTSGGKLDVEMIFDMGTGENFYHLLKVNVLFLTDVLRCTYEIKPWVGYYRQPTSTGGVVGALHGEDHVIHDITWRRGPNEFAHREMHYSFYRGLPWLVEILDGESNNAPASIDPEVEYFNDFYINILDFPYGAHDINAGISNQTQYHDTSRSYTFNYNDLWARGYIDEIFVTFNIPREVGDYRWGSALFVPDDVANTDPGSIEVDNTDVGSVRILFNPVNHRHQRFIGKLQVEERLLGKTMYVHIKPSSGRVPEIWEKAGKLRACHSRFTGE